MNVSTAATTSKAPIIYEGHAAPGVRKTSYRSSTISPAFPMLWHNDWSATTVESEKAYDPEEHLWHHRTPTMLV